MASHTITFSAEPGLTLSAYPRYEIDGDLVSLADWSTFRLACTETAFSHLSVYEVEVTDNFAEWWIMEAGATAPSDWTAFAGVSITFEEVTFGVAVSTSGTVEGRGSSASLVAYKDEEPTYTVTLENTDLTGRTLEFVIEDQEQTDKEVIADADIDAGENYFTVTIPTTITDEIGTYRWALRDITSGANTVVSFGVLSVNYAASNDP